MKFKCDRCGNENPNLGNMKHCCWFYYFKSTGQDPHLPKGEKIPIGIDCRKKLNNAFKNLSNK